MSEIVVLIATAGRPALLRRTLASIASCRLPDRYVTTLVVENGGSRRAKEVVEAFAGRPLQARYCWREEAGKSKALNSALSGMAESTLVVFTDDDVRVGAGWLEAYEAASHGLAGGAFYGGPFEAEYEREPRAWLQDYLPASASGKDAADRWWLKQDGFKGFLGFNWAAFAGDLSSVGGFDTSLGPGTGAVGDEKDVQRTLSARGVQANLVPEARVWHYVPRERCSPAWTLRRAYQQGCSKGLAYRRSAPHRGERPHREVVTHWGRSLCYMIYFALKEKGYASGTVDTFDSRYRRRYHQGVWAGLTKAEIKRVMAAFQWLTPF